MAAFAHNTATPKFQRRAWRPGEQYDSRKHIYTAGRRFYGRRDERTGAILPSHRYNDEAIPTHVSGYIHHGDEDKGEKEFFWYDLIGLDLDVNKAREDWILDGQINVEKVLDWLRGTELFQHVGYIVRTGSGGLHILLPIRPIVSKKGENWGHSTIGMAVTIQQTVLTILSSVGLPPDPAAIGMHRMWANFNNPQNVLYKNEILLKRLQSSKCESKQLTELLRVVRNELKQTLPVRLYPDARVESKLVALWFELVDAHMGCRSFSRADLLAFGFSYAFIAKIAANEIPWLKCQVEKNLDECDKLILNLGDNADLYATRAHILDVQVGASNEHKALHKLSAPELVQDGERNHWLWSLAVLLKHNGYDLQTAESIVVEAAERIPGAASSRNYRYASRIVRSIYRNHPELAGATPRALPDWLLNMLIQQDSIKLGRSPERARAPEAAKPLSFPQSLVSMGVADHPEFAEDPKLCTQNVDKTIEEGVVIPIKRVFPGNALQTSDEPLSEEERLKAELKAAKLNVFRLSSIDFSGHLVAIAQSKVDELEAALAMLHYEKALVSGELETPKLRKLAVIYRRNRIGIFDGDLLVKCLCVGWYRKRFWRAGEAQQKLESELCCKVELWYPKKSDSRMANWNAAIDDTPGAQSAAGWLGRGENKVVKLDEWRKKKGIELQPAAPWMPERRDDMTVPF